MTTYLNKVSVKVTEWNQFPCSQKKTLTAVMSTVRLGAQIWQQLSVRTAISDRLNAMEIGWANPSFDGKDVIIQQQKMNDWEALKAFYLF